MLVHHKVAPSIKFAGTHLYTWVERGTVRVKRLTQEHSTMTPARAQTQTSPSRDIKPTNNKATAPLAYIWKNHNQRLSSDKLHIKPDSHLACSVICEPPLVKADHLCVCVRRSSLFYATRIPEKVVLKYS